MRSPILDHVPPPASILERDGWEVAAHFGDVGVECEAATSRTALRDASHLSRIDFRGSDHLDFLHRMTTNDFNNLAVGSGQPAVFTDNRGRIVEAGSFIRMTEDTTRFVGGTSASERLPEWLDRYLFAEQLEWVDRMADTCMFELIGPGSRPLLDHASGGQVGDLPPFGNTLTEAGFDVARVDIGTTLRILVFVDCKSSIELWDILLERQPQVIGEVTFETLRVQFGLPLPGSELNDEHNPWEAGLGQAIHLDKGCYIGQEVIARLDTYDKVKQRLVGLALPSGALPPQGTPLHCDDRAIGTITSAVHSPVLNRNIALGYVRAAHTACGTQLQMDSPGNADEATVVDLPFSSEV